MGLIFFICQPNERASLHTPIVYYVIHINQHLLKGFPDFVFHTQTNHSWYDLLSFFVVDKSSVLVIKRFLLRQRLYTFVKFWRNKDVTSQFYDWLLTTIKSHNMSNQKPHLWELTTHGYCTSGKYQSHKQQTKSDAHTATPPSITSDKTLNIEPYVNLHCLTWLIKSGIFTEGVYEI